MPWIVSGSCNYCAACCKPPVVVENPCMVRGDTECLFYTATVDTSIRYGHCRIKQVSDNYSRVRDKNGNKITAAQIVWYEHNCLLWPARVKDIQALRDGLFALPPACTFKIVWVD